MKLSTHCISIHMWTQNNSQMLIQIIHICTSKLAYGISPSMFLRHWENGKVQCDISILMPNSDSVLVYLYLLHSLLISRWKCFLYFAMPMSTLYFKVAAYPIGCLQDIYFKPNSTHRIFTLNQDYNKWTLVHLNTRRTLDMRRLQKPLPWISCNI